MSAVSLGTGIAASVLDVMGKDEKAANILGLVSMGTGLVGTGLEMGAARLTAKAAASKPAVRLIGRASRSSSVDDAAEWIAMGPNDPWTTMPGNDGSGFVKKLHGSDVPMFRGHGNGQMKVQGLDGSWKNPAALAQELKPYLKDSPQKHPLVLVSCFGAQDVVRHGQKLKPYGHELAKQLNRDVVAFKGKVHIPSHIKHMGDPPSNLTNKEPGQFLGNHVQIRNASDEWSRAKPYLFESKNYHGARSREWVRLLWN